MADVDPAESASATSVRQRRVGQTSIAVLLCLVWPALIVLAAVLPDRARAVTVPVFVVVAVLYVLLVLAPALGTLMWFGPARLVVDDDGIFFGTDKTRRTPSTAPQLAYRAPWSAVSDLRLSHGLGTAKQMSAWARGSSFSAQASTFYGYFPCRWRREHLVLDVDLTQVDLPETATPRGNPGSGRSHDLQPSTRWVLPVRDADAVREALTARGLAVTDTDDVELLRPAVTPEQLREHLDSIRTSVDEHGGET